MAISKISFLASFLFFALFLFSNPVFSEERNLCAPPRGSPVYPGGETYFRDNRWHVISQCDLVSEEELRRISNRSLRLFLDGIERKRKDYWGKFLEKNLYRYTLTLVNESWFDVSMRIMQGTIAQTPVVWIVRDFAPGIPACSYVKIQFLSFLPPASYIFPVEVHIEDVSVGGWGVLNGMRAGVVTSSLKRPYYERVDYVRDLVYFLERIVAEPLTDDMIKTEACVSQK